MDKVSIIVPVYKVEQYLPKCIESIIHQTYKNIEILLIDDGSPDTCPKICDEYAKQDKRIQVFHRENSGVSSARNFGLEKATGDWVCFIDSDDYVCLNYVEHFMEVAKRTDAKIICASYLEIEEGQDEDNILEIGQDKISVLNKEEALYLLLCDKLRSYPWNKIFARELWDDIKWNEDYKVYEDCMTLYLLFSKCDEIAISRKKTYRYLQRSSSVLHQQSPDIFLKLFDVLDAQQKYINKCNFKFNKEIPFDLLRIEYYRRYLNYCLSTQNNMTIHLTDVVSKKHMNLIRFMFQYTDIFDKKSICSNVILLVNEKIYILWYKLKNKFI